MKASSSGLTKGGQHGSRSTTPATPWPCSWLRPRWDEIARFRDTPYGERVVVFTPDLETQRLDKSFWPKLPNGRIDSTASMQRLAALVSMSSGAAISHQPYTTLSRFTDIHEEIIEGAAGVVVVVVQCGGEDDLKEIKIDMNCQTDFCWSTKEVLDDREVFPAAKPPLILIFVGDLADPVWPDISETDNIIHCPTLDHGNTAKIVAEIYGNPFLADRTLGE